MRKSGSRLILKDIEDNYVRENFFRLEKFLDEQVFFDGDFSFFEIDIKSQDFNFKVKHSLKFIPQDVFFLAVEGDHNFYFKYQDFDRDFMYISASGPCVIRFIAGRLSYKGRVDLGHTQTYPLVVPGSAAIADHTLLTNIGTNTHAQVDSHIASTANPHAVTKTQVGLANVDNTSDVNKPVSTAQQTAINNKVTTLTGDVTGSGTSSFAATAVSIGGKTAAQVSTSVDDTIAATSLNTASAIVKRDASGNVALGKLALSGSPIDTNRFLNLVVSQAPVAATTSIFNQISVPSNASNFAVTGFRSRVLSTNSENITRRYIGMFNSVDHTGTGSTTGNNGLVGTDSFGQLQSAASMGLVSGIAGTCNNTSTGTITNGFGGIFAVSNFGVGLITTAQVVSAAIGNFNAGGTITTAYGVRVQNIINSGTVGSTFGVHVGNLTAGVQTNVPFSFFATDANAFNYFAGRTKFGAGTTIPTTGFSLDNNGGFRTESTIGEMIRANNSGLSFFGNAAVVKQPSAGAVSAGATYTATEQTMIQQMYDALRVYGLLT